MGAFRILTAAGMLFDLLKKGHSMQRYWTRFLAVLLALSLTGSAHAEPIHWTYSSSVTITGNDFVKYGTDGMSGEVGSFGSVTHGTAILFDGRYGGGTDSTSVTAFRFGIPPSPFFMQVGNYFPNDHTFDLHVRLTDTPSGASGLLTFHGAVQGSIWNGGASNNLVLTFSDSMPQTLRLGGHLYEVSMQNRLPIGGGVLGLGPGPTYTSWLYIPMDVKVVPEPTTLALLGSGLSVMGLSAWRRRLKHRRSLQPDSTFS
jgi:hypothetical protein